MKKLCVWALAAMMTVGATGAMADHLDDIKAKGKLVVGSEVSFAPFEFYLWVKTARSTKPDLKWSLRVRSPRISA